MGEENMTTDGKKPNDAVILSGARTPIGKFMGALASIPAPRLGAVAVRAAVERAGIDPQQIEEVIMGQVIAAGSGQGPARQGARYGDQTMFDADLHDGLWDPFENWAMGDAAELIANEYEVTREAMDRFALESHQKAVAAMDAGKFKAEITPVEVDLKGKKAVVDTDEAPRRDTSLEALAKLKPAFQKDGRVTAGNAPGLNDGAAAVVVASRAKAEMLGQTPLARVVGYTYAAVEPKYLFIAPV